MIGVLVNVNKINSCPNIGGKEVRRRWRFGYFSLAVTFLHLLYIIINDVGQMRVLIFLPAVGMSIAFLEALDKTCIINAFFGIKNMGEKNQRERDSSFLKTQHYKSIIIISKGTVIALGLTLLTYFI